MSEIIKNTGEVIKDAVVLTESAVSSTTDAVTNILKDNSIGFLKFLVDKHIFKTAIGVLISTQLSTLTNTLTTFLISPITEKITNGQSKNLVDWTVTIFSIEFKIGLMLQSLINFLLILIVIYYLWKFMDLQNYDIINKVIGRRRF